VRGDRGNDDGQVTVLHAAQVWLPPTQTWLHGLVSSMPPRITNHVVAATSEHLDQFAVPNLVVRKGRPSLAERVAMRLERRPDVGPVDSVARHVRPDVIHAHFGPVGYVVRRAADRVGAALVVSFYGLDVDQTPTVSQHWEDRYRELFARADRVLCLGPDMRTRLEARGCPPAKLTVHHLGVDIESIPFAPRQYEGGSPLRCLIVGSFRPKKGIPDAVAALGRVATNVPVELTVIGDSGSDPRGVAEKARIMEALARANLPVVRMLGYRPHAEVFRLALENHILLAPSKTAEDLDREGTPMTIVELAATGMPVVSTVHSDIPEIVVDGVTGLLVPEGRVDDLADSILWLAANPDRWAEMGNASRRHAKQAFSARVQAERLAQIYQEVVAGA
jgi:colanic acid/amylovoran biosynthesis glycosyltransferase